MANEAWRLEGDWIKNCSCAFGCPCDFNAKPTEGYCKGLVGMRINKGHFENVRLDGLSFCVTVAFPGALHEGNGQAQREALFNILSGKHSDEGTLFNIFSLIVTQMHDPIFAPIAFAFDKQARIASMRIPGVLETEVEPIKNPVTGLPHRIQVVMPEGFEHREGEIASSSIRSSAAIPFQTQACHSTLAHVTQTPQGVVA